MQIFWLRLRRAGSFVVNLPFHIWLRHCRVHDSDPLRTAKLLVALPSSLAKPPLAAAA